MDLISWISRNIAWPLNELREGKRELKELRELLASQYLDPAELERQRMSRLRSLIKHAYENSIFYRRRFEQAGVHPQDIQQFADLQVIPPLTKQDIVEHLDELVASNIRPEDRHRAATGGSTGRHTPFYRDNACLDRKLAAQYRFCTWTGWRIGDRLSQFWPAIEDVVETSNLKVRAREWIIERRQMLYAGKLDEGLMAKYAKEMAAFQPILIRAFPNPLSIFTKFLEENGWQGKCQPRGIVTVGEPLLPTQRTQFESFFGCPVFNCYVSRECGHLASECEQHLGLHINADCLHLEFVDDQSMQVPPGTPGKILVTDFGNFGMPFIRYEIGDMGSAIGEACACGRVLPVMNMSAGRVSDFVKSPHDQSLISGATLCHYLLADGPMVGQLQIIQDRLDHLTIRVCNERSQGGRDLEVRQATAVLDELFQGKMQVTWQEVDQIPHERSGKYRFCINEIA